jgi:predicted type IV restriction endonuclease
MADYDVGLKNMGELITWAGEHVNERSRNEATTRLHLIDVILFDCLGWERSECVAEERYDGKYTDYSLRCPQCLLIVEAKKEGIYFELPIGSEKLIYDINFFKKQDKAKGVYEAIEQVVGYCQSRGTPFGCVCNGHQLIAFIGSRNDGYPPIEGKAIVFDSLQSLQEHFLLMWQCLSKPGVIARRLSLELLEAPVAPVPEKLSKRILDYPGYKRRNTIQADLQVLSDLFIENIASLGAEADEQDFLRQCYCESGVLSQYALISKEILRARYSAMFEEATEGPLLQPAVTKKGLSPDFLARSLTQRPVLLIGDIGVGKTIFIKHLYQVRAAELLSNAIVIYINFGVRPTLHEEIRSFIGNEIEQQLRNNYGIDIKSRNFIFAVLHGDIERFNNSMYGDVRDTAPDLFKQKRIEFIEGLVKDQDHFMQLCFAHIAKGQRKQIVIFLDNVDQRPHEFQDAVFLVGQSMAANWTATIYISIRPETFHRSRVSGAISAYHSKAFTIPPPRVDAVVLKRLNYGIALLERGAPLAFGGDFSVRSDTLRDYLKVLIYSFDRSSNEKAKFLIGFLDNMSGGNIRLALDFVRIFIGSGHVNTEKILRIYREQGDYLVPLHEFMRAVIYGDHEHYSPDASEILNVFDISMPDGREHFLVPILLNQLSRWAEHSTTDGFVLTQEVYSYLQSLGFNPKQIDSALRRLLRRNLIELPTKAREDPGGGLPPYYRITTVGSYYAQALVRRFQYVDAMIVDTPIISPDYRSKIQSFDAIFDRIAMARVFCEYLDQQWKAFSDQDIAFQWPFVRRSLDRNMEYIALKAKAKREGLGDVEEPEDVV